MVAHSHLVLPVLVFFVFAFKMPPFG